MLFVVVGAPRKQSLFTISGSQKKTGSRNRQNKTYDLPGSKGTYFVCIFRKFFKWRRFCIFYLLWLKYFKKSWFSLSGIWFVWFGCDFQRWCLHRI